MSNEQGAGYWLLGESWRCMGWSHERMCQVGNLCMRWRVCSRSGSDRGLYRRKGWTSMLDGELPGFFPRLRRAIGGPAGT